MVDETKAAPPQLFPGDLVQVVAAKRQGAVVVVEENRAWGLSGYAPSIVLIDEPCRDIPLRLKYDEVARVGVAAVMSPELLKARTAAIAHATEVAREAERAAIPPDPTPDDMTMRWRVQFRFNGRTTGAGQTFETYVKAESVGDAMEVACPQLPVMDHGGSICVVGITVDEVRR